MKKGNNTHFGRFHLILLVLVLGLTGLATNGYAQKKKSREQLEKERQEKIDKLNKTNEILNQTKKEKSVNLGQLNAIKQKEKIQKSLIRNISGEVKLIVSEIEENELLLSALSSDLDTLKKEYARMIYEASKASNTYNKLMFIFTSSSFYDLQMRLNYLGQYNAARRNQVEQIAKVAETINDQIKELQVKREEKRGLLESKKIEQKNLLVLEDQKEKVVKDLTAQESDLKKKVEQGRKDIARLNEIILKFVEEVQPGSLELTPEQKLLAKNFMGNKGRHLWPVQYGFVSNKFGEHWHATISGIKVINIGIDVQTKKGSEVRCIYDGKVVAIASVPGMNKMVMVQHGDYFTVYTKIINVFVTMGQEIKRKDPIGVAYTNSEGVTEMQFQVWKNSEKLDPEQWLAPL